MHNTSPTIRRDTLCKLCLERPGACYTASQNARARNVCNYGVFCAESLSAFATQASLTKLLEQDGPFGPEMHEFGHLNVMGQNSHWGMGNSKRKTCCTRRPRDKAHKQIVLKSPIDTPSQKLDGSR